MHMIVINFFAGPGAGKSTMAAGLFYKLKSMDINCELIQEHAKEWAWEMRPIFCQAQVFGEQLARQERLLKAKLSVAITDSPLLQSLAYTPDYYPREWYDVVIKLFNRFNNVNYLIKRTKKFNPAGRFHNLEESKEIDSYTQSTLKTLGIPFTTVTIDDLDTIAQTVAEQCK